MTAFNFFKGQPSTYKRRKSYEIGELIGSGGYAEVRKATVLDDSIGIPPGTTVAIKIVNKAQLVDVELQVRTQTMVKTLRHPNIVKAYEWFESRDKFFIVFEYAGAGDLYDYLLAHQRLSESESREIVRSIVKGIVFLHDKFIVHRDLKPENILFRCTDNRADCVITDLGLATKLTGPNDSILFPCGSLGYTAPEVYSLEGYSFPSDMWSVGVITFALMGGRFPYKSTNIMDLIEEARSRPLYFPPVWTEISHCAHEFIISLLNPDPSKRMTARQALEHDWLQIDKYTTEELVAAGTAKCPLAKHDELVSIKRTQTRLPLEIPRAVA